MDVATMTEDVRPPDDAKPAKGTVSRTVLIVSVLGAIIIGGLIGGAAGVKLEQERAKDDIKQVRPVGVVTKVDDNSVTLRLKNGGGTHTYKVSDATVVDSADEGSSSDVVEGATVLLKGRSGDGGREAVEIIVLPESTKFGKGNN
jgi:hypothetical protein